jgi:hypothetical protein
MMIGNLTRLPSAEMILRAAQGQGGPGDAPPIRFVQIGSISGGTIALPAQLLRTSGIELLGSGLGSLSPTSIVSALRTMVDAATSEHFEVNAEAVPLQKIEEAWSMTTGNRRIVSQP